MVTRSSNNFGPYQFPEKVIPLFVTNLLDGAKVPLYGDGLNVRDWCYVEDNCAGVDLVLRKGEIGEIYNIGAGNEITNRELTETLLALLRCRRGACIEYVEDRLGHDRRYSIDCSQGPGARLGARRATSTRRSSRHRRVVPRQPLVVGAPEGR